MKELFELFKIMSHIIPRRVPGEADELFRQRCWAAMFMGVLYVMVLAHVLWAAGYLVQLGIDGPPTNKDVSAISTSVNSLKGKIDTFGRRQREGQVKQIASDLLKYRELQCKAVKEHNEMAMSTLAERMESLEYEYYELAQSSYVPQPCYAFP